MTSLRKKWSFVSFSLPETMASMWVSSSKSKSCPWVCATAVVERRRKEEMIRKRWVEFVFAIIFFLSMYICLVDCIYKF
ncbi:hypothetical protein QJS10_CPA03g02225 [Acorus calamus]|uniref:Transmembrane protein n=1 Tax=Acorus calamus TaxID=4465 RepID=A0AAV9F417_ACOCL|nr:hypothetical protein QJS10_CPA03g02225 [Acorus calamus]